MKRKIKILDSDKVLAEGLAELGRLDPVMARLIAEGARPAMRKRAPGFSGLAQIVMGQQLSVASADAIWAKLTGRFGALVPATIATQPDEALKACGLSAPKIRTLRAISEAITSGLLPLEDLSRMPAEKAHATLTAVKGIGPWTADIYLMFCLSHSDAFAAGDLALQEAARLAYALETRPSASELLALAEQWRPWRTVAAKVLWAHYKIAKGRSGLQEDTKLLPARAPMPKPNPKAKPVVKSKSRTVKTRGSLQGKRS
jgi:DNA-3-methyladenine glycosylase II